MTEEDFALLVEMMETVARRAVSAGDHPYDRPRQDSLQSEYETELGYYRVRMGVA